MWWSWKTIEETFWYWVLVLYPKIVLDNKMIVKVKVLMVCSLPGSSSVELSRQNAGVGDPAILQGVLTQGWNHKVSPCRQILHVSEPYHLSYQGLWLLPVTFLHGKIIFLAILLMRLFLFCIWEDWSSKDWYHAQSYTASRHQGTASAVRFIWPHNWCFSLFGQHQL